MAYVAATPVPPQFLDSNGDPLSGGTIEFYVTGTSTPATVYSDSSGTSLGTSATLNSRGVPQTSGGTATNIFYDTSVTYKIRLKNSAGTYIEPDTDPFEISSADAADSVFYTPAGSGAVDTDVQTKLREFVSFNDFGAVGDGVTDDTAAVKATMSALISWGGGVVRGNRGETYLVNETVSVPSNVTLRDVNFKISGDTFTSATTPTTIISNETFGTLSSADENITIEGCNIELTGNTAAFSPKIIALGGVKNARVRNNTIDINGGKHSSAIECYKSCEDVWIKDNKITISTGDVTGGGIWLTNKTSSETSARLYVRGNTVNQNCIDELIAVFPSVGPIKDVYINDNIIIRPDSGATTGPMLRAFCGDGLTGGTSSGTLKTVRIHDNFVYVLRSTNTTVGALQVGNFPVDSNDPEDVIVENNTVEGVFTSTAVAIRGLLSSATDSVYIKNNNLLNTGSYNTTTGVSVTEGIKVIGGKVDTFYTGVDSHWIERVEITGAVIGAVARNVAINNRIIDPVSVPLRVRSRGAGVSQLIQGNYLKPAASTRCLQLDTSTSPSVIEECKILNNFFDGSNGSVTAIQKLGSQTISRTLVEGNDFSSCATMWTNGLGIFLGRNIFPAAITNPESNLVADLGSEFWNPGGGSGTTLYVKESTTGNTGWVGK